MLRYFFLALVLALGVGCGDDDGGTDSGMMMDGGGDDAGGDDAGGDDAGGDDAGGDDAGGDDAGGDDAGTDDAGTDDAGGASEEAISHCAMNEETCGFGEADRHADEAACLAFYDTHTAACQECIMTHLGLAADNAETHCPHTLGMGPCNAACSED